MKAHRLVIALAVLIVMTGVIGAFLPPLWKRTSYTPNPRVVPLEQVALVVACLEEDLCQLPRQKVKVGQHEFWGVRVVDRDGELQFLTDGNHLKVMVSVKKGNKEEVVMMEDIGSGTVARFSFIDDTGKLAMHSEGSLGFAENIDWAQSLYFDVMEVAAKKIVPNIRTIPIIKPTT